MKIYTIRSDLGEEKLPKSQSLKRITI